MKRLLAVLLVSAGITGCGGVGSLASNDRVTNADNNQVVTIGDSIFALSGALQDNLESYAGETFRQYTISGAEVTGGIFATDIATQFQIAKADNSDIETVIMDAAGNDILIPIITLFDVYDCKTQWYQWWGLSRSCKNLIDDLYVDTVGLLNTIDASGVDNVIFLGYYHTKNALLLLDSVEEAVDYGNGRLAQACANSNANCTFVDPRSSINDNDIIIDGIHPASSGSLKLANLIWPVLQPLL
jgi:lysophospholipase L1-like esterase